MGKQPSNWTKGVEGIPSAVFVAASEDLSLHLEEADATYASMSTITREEMDAKFSLSEARVEKSLADMRAELVGLRGDFNTAFASVPSRGFIAVTAVAIVGAVIGAMALGYTQFGNGVMVTTVAVQDAQDAKRLAQENANEVRAMRNELSSFLAEFKAAQRPPTQP